MLADTHSPTRLRLTRARVSTLAITGVHASLRMRYEIEEPFMSIDRRGSRARGIRNRLRDRFGARGKTDESERKKGNDRRDLIAGALAT